MQPKIILLDGSAFLFRAYFAMQAQHLTNNDGFPTGAIFGVINAIKRLMRQYQEAEIIAIFDAKGDNFRHDIYPKYKMHRKPMEKDLSIQIKPLYDIIRAMGLPFISVPCVEADDVIATLCTQAVKQGIPLLIASGDKDLYQLVDESVHQIDMKGKYLDHEAIVEKMGVCPEQMLDFLSLTGDQSDNIPGVPGIGPKTALVWLKKYKTLENIKKNAYKIKGKIGGKLRENFALIDLSYSLIKLKHDVNITIDFKDCAPKPDYEKLANLYQKYSFREWFRQLKIKQAKTTKTNKDRQKTATLHTVSKSMLDIARDTKNLDILSKYEQKLILDEVALNDLVTEITTHKVFVFDAETTSLNYMCTELVGLVFLLGNVAYYIPVAHKYLDAPKQLKRGLVLSVLKPIFENSAIKKNGQNLKYDAHVLANYAISLNGISEDTMLKSYCLNSTASLHNIDNLAAYYLNYKTIKSSEVVGRGKKQISFDKVNIDNAAKYACEDVIIARELNQILTDKINTQPALKKLYYELELPFIYVLKKMERNGVFIDSELLKNQQQNILSKTQKLKKKMHDLAKKKFNLDSPKQVRDILFNKGGLNLEASKTTPSGEPSTDEEALKLLKHPLAETLLEYRALSKLNSTYLEALPKQINPKTRRIHTSYHQAGTVTGRLSSSHPNLQNIPIRTQNGANIRRAFIAPKNYVIIALDYSQIELRIMAHLSQDEVLLSAFYHNLDIHKATASEVFNLPVEALSTEHRRRAKAINFGLMYGMSAFGLAKQINCTRSEAKIYIDTYFRKYPKVKQYIENIKISAKQQGFVETITGRRLYLPHIDSSNNTRKQHALRTAVNAPMQGSSADIIKRAMLDIDSWINTRKRDIKMIMQVHDELVFETHKACAEQDANEISALMKNAFKISVPLLVKAGIADNWQEAHFFEKII